MSDPRICLYFRREPERDRWIAGDRFVRPAVRRLVRGRPRVGGVEKVFVNLCLGLDRLGVDYEVNLAFERLRETDRVAVLGRGRQSLDGYDRANPIVAGIGLMTHPAEWPTLCDDYPVVRYLQHSEWTTAIYRPYFGARCGTWPVGIDTVAWSPSAGSRDLDVLIYDKVQWDRTRHETTLIEPIRDVLRRRKLRFAELRYGSYSEAEFRQLLGRTRSMVFVSESESQGLAYQECLSSGVPVIAWDQGWWLDPNRVRWGSPRVRAKSVPYFDSRCGVTFSEFGEFEPALDRCLQSMRDGELDPRAYILEHLTLERCSERFVDILREDLDSATNRSATA